MKVEVKNPLSQVLGLILQEMRKEARLQVDDVADKLGVSTSHYRLVESASTRLTNRYALEVIKVFPAIEFLPLSVIQTGTAVIGNAGDDSEAILKTLEELELISPFLLNDVFRSLQEFVNKGLHKKGTKQATEFFMENDTYEKLRIYLTTSISISSPHDGYKEKRKRMEKQMEIISKAKQELIKEAQTFS